MRAALDAFQGVTGVRKGEGAAAFDTGLSAEALYALAAMMIETLPGVATNRDLRVMAEEAGSRIHYYLRIFRDTYEKTGRHPIEHLGAVATPDQLQ